MLPWILQLIAKGCRYKTTFMMTKERWHRSTEEKTLSKPPRGKRFQIKCSMKWIWKIQLCRRSGRAKDLWRKGCLVSIPQSMTFIANAAWQRLSSSDLPSARPQHDMMRLAIKWKLKLNLRSSSPPPHLESIESFVCPHWLILSESLSHPWICCTH